jgi:hypothetical protein
LPLQIAYFVILQIATAKGERSGRFHSRRSVMAPCHAHRFISVSGKLPANALQMAVHRVKLVAAM